jgi:DNA-binding FadR family transcriptional regulator
MPSEGDGQVRPQLLDGEPLRQLDSRLLAMRARTAILRAIFAGRFESKLPNEDRLAEMLNVSRSTVRTALQGLERDGVVTRQRAIGTMINPHKSWPTSSGSSRGWSVC